MIPRLPTGYTHPLLTGEGAFSSVYRVRQTSLDRWVAMKIITERDGTRRSELILEAKTQANIHLDCIPQIYDTFEWDKRICIVMQWLKGVSLREILDLSPSLANRHYIAHYLISTIAALHEQGFAHRDLKPENVFISPESGLYLVDFGFTKSVNDLKKSMSGIIKGTPAYMAPELWNVNVSVNPLRTDLYSLGKILMELFPNEFALQTAIVPLLDSNPDKRPQSARRFFDSWETITPMVSGTTNWMHIADSHSRERHSRKLLAASRELLYAKRYDESYWLLVECLEEDPDYTEALDLMGKFPKTLNNSRKKIFYYTALTIALLMAILAFFAGKLTQENISVQRSNNLSITARSSQLLDLPRYETDAQIIRLMQDTVKSVSLKGRVFITGIPDGGTLLLDNSIIDRSLFEHGLEMLYGLHIIVLENDSGSVLWKEKFRLLPFQKKYLSVKQRTN